MARKERLTVIIGSSIVVLLLCIGILYGRAQDFKSNKPFKVLIHGTWKDSFEKVPFNWISFNVVYNELPDGKFKYFYYNPLDTDESGNAYSEEGEGYLDEEAQEIFFDSGSFAGESLKLDSEGQLVAMSTGQTLSKIDDNYGTVRISPADE